MKKIFQSKSGSVSIPVIIVVIIAVLLTAAIIYFAFFGTESGKRRLNDLKSEFGGGLEREINVYTANGDKIASYKGKIDIEESEGGYVKFDYEGKRYIYYNCFVETIATIPK